MVFFKRLVDWKNGIVWFHAWSYKTLGTETLYECALSTNFWKKGSVLSIPSERWTEINHTVNQISYLIWNQFHKVPNSKLNLKEYYMLVFDMLVVLAYNKSKLKPIRDKLCVCNELKRLPISLQQLLHIYHKYIYNWPTAVAGPCFPNLLDKNS